MCSREENRPGTDDGSYNDVGKDTEKKPTETGRIIHVSDEILIELRYWCMFHILVVYQFFKYFIVLFHERVTVPLLSHKYTNPLLL